MWVFAAEELLKMEVSYSVQEKLMCFLECFKVIVNALSIQRQKKTGAGADDTLPILIYIILNLDME